jgi:hypothetical protein
VGLIQYNCNKILCKEENPSPKWKFQVSTHACLMVILEMKHAYTQTNGAFFLQLCNCFTVEAEFIKHKGKSSVKISPTGLFFVCVWSFVTRITRRKHTEGFREQGKDKDICTYVERRGRSMKLHNNRFMIRTCRQLSMKTRMGWVGHVACMEQKRNCGNFWGKETACKSNA